MTLFLEVARLQGDEPTTHPNNVFKDFILEFELCQYIITGFVIIVIAVIINIIV